MTSTSSLGSTSIVLQFDLDRNIDGAARDVQAAINAARTYLPPSLPMNPTLPQGEPGRRADPDHRAHLRHHEHGPAVRRSRRASCSSGCRASRASGQVFVGGSSLPAVRVELNPQALSRHGVGLEDVRAHDRRHQRAAADRAARRRRHACGRSTPTISCARAEQYRPIIVAWENGAPLRLDDVADVRDSVEDLRAARHRPTASRPSSWSSSAAPAPTSSRPSTGCARRCRSSRRRCPRR